MDMERADILRWLVEADGERLGSLWVNADRVRSEHVGDAVHLRGLIEFSNHCSRQCMYCGLRAGNRQVQRYRMSAAEIVDTAQLAQGLGCGTVVLQGGEDPGISPHFLAEVIHAIKDELGLAVTLSFGEQELQALELWRQAGADRYLLRFETSNEAIYQQIHPSAPGRQAGRLELLCRLRELGYEIGSGVMVGIPGTTVHDLVADLLLFRELDLDMIGVGPYVPNADTPLGASVAGRHVEPETMTIATCKVIALARLLCPHANIPSTSALSTVDPENGRILGLMRGGNVIMPNLTPPQYRRDYVVYPGKAGADLPPVEIFELICNTIASMGRVLGSGRGDSPRYLQRLAQTRQMRMTG